ncbi:SCO family protein [Pseudoroseicyclus tamaricis]|uniref:SCO family protein n=1 Tax=Pseudoroseicyclus tamaricis TaxID=2705421 RepID=A0A6B2JM47_9RHOB|nr:SCO family protein [Pseudoroseicyclus tamaricis]NDV02653.1 SCO family protein [Pseudoroseicyclus tamaricis]
MTRTSTIALAGAVIVLAGLAGSFLATTGLFAPEDRFSTCRAGSVAGGDLGGPFTLVSETGEEVTDAQLFDDELSLVYFGYTYCPDVCPIDAQRNALAVSQVEEETGVQVQPLLITVDPARDTPEVLARYTENFHDRMLGLTGSETQVRGAAEAWRVFYSRGEGEGDNYLMSHSAFSYIVLPGGTFGDVVRREETPESLAERLACFADAAN